MGARILNDWININNPGSTVLYPEQLPFGATLSGTPIYPTWYSPSNDVSFHSITNDGSSLAFFNDKKIDYAISHINDTSLPGTVSWELRHFLSRYALPIVQAGDLILYRFVGSEIPYIETYSDATTYTIGTEPQRLGSFSAGNANALRYNAEFACADDAGYFAAQINWDNGEYYYHEVPCSAAPLQFIEAMPLPPGVNGGDLWARVTSGQQAATLNSLSIESIESIETTE